MSPKRKFSKQPPRQAKGAQATFSRTKAAMSKILLAMFGFIVPFLLFEILAAAVLHYPLFANWRSLTFAQLIYDNDFRNIIQFEPAFAQYDPELMYALRPGSFQFQNPEFSVRYGVNRLGLRDSDDALVKPDVIVLGDSEAMGWGVRQEETYAKQLEKKSGLKVLNAAVSSYGTVREMRLLDRLDVSNLNCLIIHYMQNDDIENSFFSQNRYTLKISNRQVYDDMVQRYLRQKKYYPGKYIRLSFRYGLGVSDKAGGDLQPGLYDRREKIFLNAVMHASHINLSQTKIIVLSTEADSTFCTRLQEEIQRGDYPPYIKKMTVLSVASKLKRPYFFALDEHMQAKGHAVVADALIEQVRTKR